MNTFPKLLLPAALISLILGFACQPAGAEPEHPPKPGFAQQLGLSAEQAARVDEVLHRGRERHDEVREQTRKELGALLSPAQLTQLERLMPPSPPPHPPHAPPAPPTPPTPPAVPDHPPR